MILFKVIRSGLLVILIVSLLFVCFLLGTNGGLHVAQDIANDALPGQITSTHLKGNLLQGFSASNVRYLDANHELNIEKIQLKISPWALFFGILKLNKININRLHWINLTTTKQTKSSIPILSFPLTIHLNHVHLHQIILTLATGQAPIQLSDVRLQSIARDEQWHVTSTWQRLFFPITNHRQLNIIDGKLTINGQHANYQFQGETTFDGKQMPSGKLRFQGKGKPGTLHINTFLIDLLSGQLHGQATIDWLDSLHWQAQIIGHHLQPQVIWPAYPGKIQFKLKTSGKLNLSTPHLLKSFNLTLESLSGKLRGQSLSGQGDIHKANGHWMFHHVQSQLGQNHFSINGKIAHNNHIQGVIVFNHLNTWDPSWRGSLNAQLQLTGSLDKPNLIGQVRAKQIRLFHIKLQQGLVKIHYLGQHPKHSYLHLTTNHLSFHKHKLLALSVNVQGLITKQQINIIGKTPKVDLQLNASTSWLTHHDGPLKNNKIWAGKINRLHMTLLHKTFATHRYWQLSSASPFSLNFTKHLFALKHACFHSKQSSLCIKEIWGDRANWQTAIQGSQLPGKWLNPLFHHKLKLDANLSIHAAFTNHHHHLHGTLLSQISTGTLHFKHHGFVDTLNIISGKWEANVNTKGTQNHLYIHFKHQQHIQLDFRLPHFQRLAIPKSSQVLQAHLKGHFTQINFAMLWLPDITKMQGYLDANLYAKGTLKHPDIRGKGTLAIQQLHIPVLGLQLKNVTANITGKPDAPLAIKAFIPSGDGTLHLSGHLYLKTPEPYAQISATGDQLLVIHTKAYQVIANPNLTLHLTPDTANLEGYITIPEAHIFKKKTSSSASLPDDVVYAAQIKHHKKHSPFRLSGNIKIMLGNKVHIHVKGLKGKLEGSLVIHQVANQAPTAQGQLALKQAVYEDYGHKLTISHGLLLYSGNALNNPGLNISAIRKFDDVSVTGGNQANINLGSQLQQLPNITQTRVILPGQESQLIVGVHIQGSANNPRVTLFSEPAMLSQSDILSLLIFGRSVSTLSGNSQSKSAEAQTLFQVASTLNLGASNLTSIQQQLKHHLGFDEFGIETTTLPSTYNMRNKTANINTNTSLVVGKRLSKRLFVNYSLGLIEPVHILKLRFLLNKHWTLQGENTSSGNGIDLFYTFEH